mgnify:FL=1
MSSKRGFTLIELLVVMAIIGILSSIAIVSLSQGATKSRDARREVDIKELQKILALYESNRGRYPICSSEVQVNGTSDCLSLGIISEAIVNVLPKDPKHGVGGGSCGDSSSFYYCYVSADGSSYTIRYNLETDSIYGKSAGWNSANP